MNEELTFRDFAAAVMSNDLPQAASVLGTLLNVPAAVAQSAAETFHRQMSGGPEFMMKAMGLRQVVQSGDEGKLRELLTELFGLDPSTLETAVAAIRTRYPG